MLNTSTANDYLEVTEFIETGSLKHSYRNKLDKSCFTYNAAYSDSKDLVKR